MSNSQTFSLSYSVKRKSIMFANLFVTQNNLAAGNIAYHLLQEVGGAEAIGPILLGLRKPVYVLQLGSSVRQIVNIVAMAVMEAQAKEEK